MYHLLISFASSLPKELQMYGFKNNYKSSERNKRDILVPHTPGICYLLWILCSYMLSVSYIRFFSVNVPRLLAPFFNRMVSQSKNVRYFQLVG